MGEINERLWLLKKLSISNDPLFCDDGGIPDNTIISPSLLTLNAVALYLTTSKPDGVIASFYSFTHNKLYLAKSGRRDPEDDGAVAALLDALDKAQTSSDLLPFLAQRSAGRVNKRIRKLRDSVTALYEDLTKESGRHECFSDPDDPEFPGPLLRKFRRMVMKEHPEADISSDAKFLAYLIETLHQRLNDNPPFEDTQEARLAFLQLTFASKILLYSRFFEVYYRRTRGVVKLKRRLEKIAQYLDAGKFIQFYKRETKRKDPPFSIAWVPDAESECSPYALQLTSTIGTQYLDAIMSRHASDSKYKADYREGMLSYFDRFCPGWTGEDTPPVPLHVHPELRLILYLTTRGGPGAVQDERLFVGCSQSCCVACMFWVRMFNAATRMRWALSPPHFQPRYDWVFPRATGGPDGLLQPEGAQVVLRQVGELIEKIFLEELGKVKDHVREDKKSEARAEMLRANRKMNGAGSG